MSAPVVVLWIGVARFKTLAAPALAASAIGGSIALWR
jgi:hypothetical protein